MKYDVLEKVKKHLYATRSANTAKTYYAALNKLFAMKQFGEASDLTEEDFMKAAVLFKGKNEFSAAKNAMKAMQEVYPEIKIPAEQWFKNVSRKKRNYSKKPAKTIYLDTTLRKINAIPNDKLKYAYRLAVASGLRVSELADLEAGDITFREDGIIHVEVRHGKGDKYGQLDCRKDEYLYEKLQEYCRLNKEGKLFYSEAYMRERADNLGLECHDFRRIFAITRRKELKKQMPVDQADEQVRLEMRHARFSTTKRYLYNRKLIMKK